MPGQLFKIKNKLVVDRDLSHLALKKTTKTVAKQEALKNTDYFRIRLKSDLIVWIGSACSPGLVEFRFSTNASLNRVQIEFESEFEPSSGWSPGSIRAQISGLHVIVPVNKLVVSESPVVIRPVRLKCHLSSSSSSQVKAISSTLPQMKSPFSTSGSLSNVEQRSDLPRDRFSSSHSALPPPEPMIMFFGSPHMNS